MSQLSTIFDEAVACRESFREAVNMPQLMKDEWAENCSAKFKLWSAGAGIAAADKGSLDARLAQAPEGRDVVINLLRMLKVLLSKCIEKGEDKISSILECQT
jgi:hypothetical protein